MEKKNIECLKCKETEDQIRAGFTSLGNQRYLCKKCGCKYSLIKKQRGYSEEERKQALRMMTDGATGRSVGRQLNMSKANAYRWSRELAKKGALKFG